MPHPVLFVIDDDAGVVRGTAPGSRPARRGLPGHRYLVGAAGLTRLRELADEHVTVAVLIVDHKMREMPGLGFLANAHGMHPQARRVLMAERDVRS